ncbi:hypothetical protein M1N68_01445 [Peptococcaceae bacterium]|nr:hypothetical protein [Peptococcaceae bacterium]MCL0107954.1 hypothetical protein [Peptococcaceae bacterium]
MAVLLAFTPIKAAQAYQEPPLPPPERIITLVKENLASYLKVSPDEITVASVTPVVWNDSSLGVPKPGKYYLPVLTPGYIIFLEHNNKIYRYHTDTRSRYVRAWEWRGWFNNRPILPIEPIPPIRSPELPFPIRPPINPIIPPPSDEHIKIN